MSSVKTLEFSINVATLKDHIDPMFRMTGFVHDDEEIVDLQILGAPQQSTDIKGESIVVIPLQIKIKKESGVKFSEYG